MKKNFLIIIPISIFILFCIYIFIEPFWIEVKENIIIDKDIEEQFDGFKIVFICDIHHGPFFSKKRVKNLVKRINNMKPDLILLGGDYVLKDKKYIEPVFEELKFLKAKYGVYGVLGNHDHWESADLTRQNMLNSNIKILDNTAYWIDIENQRIKIGGIGDMWEDSQDISSTIEDVEEEDFVILVSHNPDYAEDIYTDKIDLLLCGHTHGGQVTFFGLWAPFIPSKYGQKYRTGVVINNNIKVIISNGIGTITPPVRFFARPQINLIYLKMEEN